MKDVILVIPARYGSTRLHAKPLAEIHGKPMIQWVYERARRAKGIDQVLVATDDTRIAERVQAFGGHAVITSPEIQSGTERIASLVNHYPARIYVNVQGDEPLMEPVAIEKAVELVHSGRFPVGTVMTPLKDLDSLKNPAVVKVITDCHEKAIYFSRHPIPYSRGALPEAGEPFACRQHVGLYVYSREVLSGWGKLRPSAIERAEVLEQLRLMENGISIGVTEVDFTSIGVDTPEDLEKVRNFLTP